MSIYSVSLLSRGRVVFVYSSGSSVGFHTYHASCASLRRVRRMLETYRARVRPHVKGAKIYRIAPAVRYASE